jgi:hypothetical protein
VHVAWKPGVTQRVDRCRRLMVSVVFSLLASQLVSNTDLIVAPRHLEFV